MVPGPSQKDAQLSVCGNEERFPTHGQLRDSSVLRSPLRPTFPHSDQRQLHSHVVLDRGGHRQNQWRHRSAKQRESNPPSPCVSLLSESGHNGVSSAQVWVRDWCSVCRVSTVYRRRRLLCHPSGLLVVLASLGWPGVCTLRNKACGLGRPICLANLWAQDDCGGTSSAGSTIRPSASPGYRHPGKFGAGTAHCWSWTVVEFCSAWMNASLSRLRVTVCQPG